MADETKVEDFGANSSAGEYFKPFKPLFEEIEATQVTPAFLSSLPRGGKNIQRFGNQAEVYGSNGLKSYAQESDFVVRLGEDYFVVTPKVFNALFQRQPEPVVDEKAAAEAPVAEGEVLTPPPVVPVDDGRPLDITEKPLDGEPVVDTTIPAQEVDPVTGEVVEKVETQQTQEDNDTRKSEF